VTVVERPLAHPQRVDVVTAESVDAAMSGIGAELARLRRELLELEAEAHQLECRVEEAGRRTEDSDSALPLLEHVFAAQAATTRAELRSALDEAVEIAERRLAVARADADTLMAGLRFPVTGDRAERHDVVVEVGTMQPGCGGGDTHPKTSHFDERGTLWADGPRDGSRVSEEKVSLSVEPDPTAVHAAVFPDEEHEPPRLSSGDPLAPVPSLPATTHEDPGNFGRFWAEQSDTAGGHGSKPALLDALLPLLAVAIVVVVVLSWIG